VTLRLCRATGRLSGCTLSFLMPQRLLDSCRGTV
jgi:hypothetical protein